MERLVDPDIRNVAPAGLNEGFHLTGNSALQDL